VTHADSLTAALMTVISAADPGRHFRFSIRRPDGGRSGSRPSRHGLKSLKRLEHDVGYLQFDGLTGNREALEAVTRRLVALPDVKALVVDIRENIGGSGDMVSLLCSHLLERATLLYRVCGRSGGPGEVGSTVCERLFPREILVYVLTGRATVSAAEAFAYIQKDLKRATIVGERAAGLGNPSRTWSIEEDFTLTVPFLRIRYGSSGGEFGGVGVIPDSEVRADQALSVALAEIEKRFRADRR